MSKRAYHQQGAQGSATSVASLSQGDSAGVAPAAGRHVLGGYWIAAAVVVIALVTAYYRRRWRRPRDKS